MSAEPSRSSRRIAGRVFRYGDAVSTDALFPGRYTYTHTTPEEIAPHALEDLDPDFARSVRPGDVVVGGRGFGCGSSREQAVTCLVAHGVGAVIAASLARIFLRNAINAGLPAIACPQAVEALERGDAVTIDLDASWIETPRGRFAFPPFAPNVRLLLRCGGLLPYVRERLRAEESPGAPEESPGAPEESPEAPEESPEAPEESPEAPEESP